MIPHLYALKEDLDMVIQDVSGLKTSYMSIDHIAKRFDDLWHEQTMQAEQMRRIEEQMRQMGNRLNNMEKRLMEMEARLGKVEERLDKMEARLSKVENRLDNIEKLLLLICQKLDINLTS